MKPAARIAVALLLLCGAFLSGCQSDRNNTVNNVSTSSSGETNTAQGSNETETNDPNTPIPENVVWSGPVASAFADGDGSEANPYQIADASQLAFLAKEINSGKDYRGKYFSLTADIDLNHTEWVPIGNGTQPFSGTFLGNGHTIRNLNIQNGVAHISNSYFSFSVSDDKKHNDYTFRDTEFYSLGLFGTCSDSVIRRLNIDNAEIRIPTPPDMYLVYAGVLMGSTFVSANTEFSDIKISNALISADLDNPGYYGGSIGGVIGGIETAFGSDLVAQRMQSDVKIIDPESVGTSIGGLIGSVEAFQKCTVRDCASYLTMDIALEEDHHTFRSVGAIGSIFIVEDNIALSNIFSSITYREISNRIQDRKLNDRIYAVIGSKSYLEQPGDTANVNYQFQNLFGYVRQKFTHTNEERITEELYAPFAENNYQESNCVGCTSLPENHGFDPEIWDLSHPERPEIEIITRKKV